MYNGKRIREVKTSFNTALTDSEIEDFHFHDLRHMFASQLLLKGGSLKDVQELLGHKDIKMTVRYIFNGINDAKYNSHATE